MRIFAVLLETVGAKSNILIAKSNRIIQKNTSFYNKPKYLLKEANHKLWNTQEPNGPDLNQFKREELS